MTLPFVYRDFFKESEQVPNQFWGNEGAGALFLAKDTGRLLLFLRSAYVNEPHTWNLIGGKIDDGENPKEAVMREIEEEAGYNKQYRLGLLYTFQRKNFKYHNYIAVVKQEFVPDLNWEHTDYQWFDFDNLPSPLHFGMVSLLHNASTKIRKIIDVAKKSGNISEDMNVQPAIIQPVQSLELSNDFKNFVKSVENGNKLGYDPKTKLWKPHKAAEGGYNIGYGHKILRGQEKHFIKGITDREVEQLFDKDLKIAKNKVLRYHLNWVKQYIELAPTKTNSVHYNFLKNLKPTDPLFILTPKQLEMLTDFTFNLGTLNKFPMFADAVLRKDWITAKQQFQRVFTDKKGVKHPIEHRNKEFEKRYF